MTTKDQDTDPSTPGALRGLAPTDPTPAPIAASLRVSTDPGVGPPSSPPMAAALPMTTQRINTPPMGIVVPASLRVKPRKDSVELLLDGMQGPQPERPKTMPATDGQASASYHAEHMVRPARTSPDEVPKVVVERPPQAPTTRIDRGKVQAVIEAADARRRAMEATAVVPQQIAPRVVVAIVAGLMVVLGLFVVARLSMGGAATAGASPAHAPTTVAAATPTSTSTPTPTPTSTSTPDPTSAQATATADPPSAAVTADPPAAAAKPVGTAATWPNSPTVGKPKTPRAAPGSTAAGDIGEFKTTLH